MASEGRNGASSILVRGGQDGGVLRQAVARVVDGEIDHLVGIAVDRQIGTWVDAVADETLESVTLLYGLDEDRPITPDSSDNIQVRYVRGDSLGDLGIAVVDAIAEGNPTRAGVVVDSVGALTEDPGKRFKFLSLIGQRVSVDDGTFLASKGASRSRSTSVTPSRPFSTTSRPTTELLPAV